MNDQARRVQRIYLTLTLLATASASLIWGINTLFLLHAGLSIFEVFVANAAFTAAMALFEIPTGVVADTRGRRASFLLSEATLAVGTLAYVGVAAIHGGLLLFCLAGVILGLGYTFYSGAVEAWLVDALKATGYTRELDGVFAKASIVSSVAMIVGTIGGGLLGQINLSLPYIARAALVLIAFAVGYRTMHEIGFTPRTMHLQGIVGEMRKVGRAGITFGAEHNAAGHRLLVEPEDVHELFDSVPGLHFVWDLNHTAAEDVGSFLGLRDRLSLVHVSDTPLPATNHHLPLGRGNVDFSILRELDDVPVILEIGGLPISGGPGFDTDDALLDSRVHLHSI